MSILTSASGASVSRGYDYYKRNMVKNINQLNDHEFEGYVYGSRKEPYYVKINIEHPRKSYCDCPHANGNITCKHMTALYFELFPEEVEDYESWLNSDYDEYDEYDDYYDFDDYDDDDYYDSKSNNFNEPLFFETVLKNYVESLNTFQLKDILFEELNNNKKRTYELYLDDYYNKYIQSNNDNFIFLEKLNKKIQDMIEYYDYNYNDYNKEILSVSDKEKIRNIYQDKNLKSQIDKLLLNEKLSVYSDYKWIASFYKENKNSEAIELYCKTLEEYLDSLKHYSIKNNTPKSNVLIAIYLLNDFTIPEIALSIQKNARYIKYVEYVIENSDNVSELYDEFMKLINKNYLKNKIYIPEVLYNFVCATEYENKEININHYLYSYLCLGHKEYLEYLSLYLNEDKIIELIEKKTKDIFLLLKLYKFYNKADKIWNLLTTDSKYNYQLLDNIEILKEKYNDKLYKHFIEEFYKILNDGKKRENYQKASIYISAISQLDNGNELVNNIVMNLKKSDYQKCSALFDEINNAIKISKR